MKKLSKNDVERVKNKILEYPFFHKRSLIGNGRFSLVFNKSHDTVIKVTLDRGFVEYTTPGEIPASVHYPRCVRSYGTIKVDDTDVHILEIEKLYPLIYTNIYNSCLLRLKDNFKEVSNVIHDKETAGYKINVIDLKIEAIAKSFATEYPSIKTAINNLRDFANKNDLSLNRFFLSPFENLMVRPDETFVFANPLCADWMFDDDVFNSDLVEYSELMKIYREKK